MTFSFVREIGSGYFGTVILEFDESLRRLCATKRTNANQAALGVSSFLEARTMLLAKHPNVVEVFQAGLENGQPFIRMEYLPKGSVADLLKGQPATVSRGIRMLTDAARGLEYLHSLGLLHRDVKASNLLIADTGDIKLADFGLSGVISEPKTLADVGYALTWPPENVSAGTGIDSAQGDIYALGITAIRILNGDAVYFGAMPERDKLSAAIMAGRFPDRKAWLPHLHEPLRRAIRKAIHPNPSRRFRTAQEFRYALERSIPAISWSYAQARGTASWIASRNEKSWEAHLQPGRAGQYNFELRSSRAGSKPRMSGVDSLENVSFTQAATQAELVLTRIAMTGK